MKDKPNQVGQTVELLKLHTMEGACDCPEHTQRRDILAKQIADLWKDYVLPVTVEISDKLFDIVAKQKGYVKLADDQSLPDCRFLCHGEYKGTKIELENCPAIISYGFRKVKK